MAWTIKRSYPGVKGLYVEFFNAADAEACYQKGLSFGSRIEKQDELTIVMKFSSANLPPS